MQTSTSTEGHRAHVALALQGGGAIGAFQAGVLEALDTAGVHIDACCGASIGAINAALFFGNEPACRIERLRAFWDAISVPDGLSHAVSAGWLLPFIDDSTMRRALAEAEQGYAMMAGLPGFFSRRLVVPVLRGNGNPANASVFDMQPLLRTLAALCDFDRLNAGSTRVSVVATHVARGDAHFFDNRDTPLDVTRIAASSALPPWFAPVKIDDEWYWDGSLSAGLPLKRIVETAPADKPTVVLRADLWSGEGAVPDNMTDVEIRQKNILQASRAALFEQGWRDVSELQATLAHALERIDARAIADDPRLAHAASRLPRHALRIVPVDYRRTQCETHFKDGQFGKAAIAEHWENGQRAAEAVLAEVG
ncbi:patatin-like phospholipase family protein [Burkholderia multivorans]|uniref:patatin-like phospholipase family protein n=1 Tax=Burkholderia multivorans TaxID=87883 RepID=UPI0020A42D51|nr:patatin-like phospholipase family protein [Burkholderia multivorans]MCO8574717.1 patatin-like phospholipase family protein [Burkholderia multivorans]